MLSYELWEGYDVITFHCVRLLLTSSTNLIGLLKVVIAIYYAWKKLKYSFHFLLRLPIVCYINQLWFIYSSRTRLELIRGAIHWGWRSGDGIMFPKYDYSTIMLWWIIDALSLARFRKFVKKCSIIDALCVLSLFVRFLFCFREKVSLPHSTCLNVTLGDLRGTNKGPVHLFEVYTLVSFRDKIYVRTWKGDYKVFSVTGTALFGFFFLFISSREITYWFCDWSSSGK